MMTYLKLFWGFLKVGLFAFGGGYGAIPLIRDVVLEYGFIDEETLTMMIAVSESTPGPIMVNLATYVGSVRGGVPGAFLATFAVVLPSFFIVILITAVLMNLMKNRYVEAALGGLKPCIAGIILATGAYMIWSTCVPEGKIAGFDLVTTLFVAGLALVYFLSRKIRKRGLSPIGLIILSAICGVVIYGYK